jgi:phosphate transport system protein
MDIGMRVNSVSKDVLSAAGPVGRGGGELLEMEDRDIERYLDLLRDKILLLGGKTETAVNSAVQALIERNTDLALEVRANDKIIDQMELEIDQLSIEILGSQQPESHDLRLVVSVAKITPILERIADHASSIAEAAIVLNNEPEMNSYADFSLMAGIAADMLREALDAFTAEDAEKSREIIRRDKRIDDAYKRVFDDLIRSMTGNPSTANGSAQLMFVAKHLERIGDYVKDICELNVYLREAVFIKHSSKN